MTTMESISSMISVEDLRSLLANDAHITVLDIRTTSDRAEWSIPGSLHLDAYDALRAGDPDALSSLDLPRDRPVVTVCNAGFTSQIAVEQLRARGIDAVSLEGGMRAWSLAWNTAELELPGSTTVVQVRRTGKGCLSYIAGNGGEAAVIDPALDPEVYIALARERGWTITRVIETHIHADHLSSARALAAATGATLHLPAQDRARFPFAAVHDGARLPVGEVFIRAIATAGHTLESMSYLLDGRALFTGDTLFLNAVGRPDLEVDPGEASHRAHKLYASLQTILRMPGGTLVLPGHTDKPVAFNGSLIGKNLGEVVPRIAVLWLSEHDFVSHLLARIPPPPANHSTIVSLNEAGAMPDSDRTTLEAGANRCAIG